MLVIVSTLWALEGVPLYVTSLMIPVIVVWFKILPAADGVTPLSASDAASVISQQFWSPTIFLFLGGFTIAAALEKYGLNRALVGPFHCYLQSQLYSNECIGHFHHI